MQFINPLVLWGLLLLILPIIFHLFYFRRYKEVKFTNVKFLSELQEEKSVRDRLRQLLILLMRLGALAFLIFAFARPFLPGDKQEEKGKKSVSIYVDNSFSMQAFGDEIAHLDKALRIAEKIVKTYDREDEFQIITNDFGYGDQRWITADAAVNNIREIELSPVTRGINEIISRQEQIRYKPDQINRSFYLISDFQEPILPESITSQGGIDINFVYISSSKQPNLSIDSIWMTAPVFEYGQINSLHVKISNYGDADIRDAGLSLKYGGQVKPLGVLAVGAGESRIDTINIVPQKAGWQEAVISVNDYPVDFDNSYFIAFDVPQKLNVLSLYGESASSRLQSILNGLKSIDGKTATITQLDYDELPSYDLVILHDIRELSGGIKVALGNYVKNGGKVLLFPRMDPSSANYRDLINDLGGLKYDRLVQEERAVYTLNKESYVFNSVYEATSERLALPTVNEYYIMESQGKYPIPLLSFRDGQPFVTQVQSGNGYLYQCATSLGEESSSLLKNSAILIPMIYRMALQRNVESKLSYTIGEETIIPIPHPTKTNLEEPIKVKGPIEFIPGQQAQGQSYVLDMHNEVTTSGIYDVVLRDSVIRKLGFNYNRLESNLQQPSASKLSELYPEVNIIDGIKETAVEDYIKSASLGKELWRWCLILVLIFLILEQIFVRFLRKD